MIAVDTNLLVYAHRASTEKHKAAREAIEEVAGRRGGWGVALACVAEFWSVVTHPLCEGGPSPPEAAREFLQVLVEEAGCTIWSPGRGFWERLTRLAGDLGVQGMRVYDLQIGLTAFDNGATEIWTHDRGFVGFPGLVVRDPLRDG